MRNLNLIALRAHANTLHTYGLNKLSALDPKRLAGALESAQLAESPDTIQFKTPSGHTVESPYMESVVEHHSRRLGGPAAYYKDLGRALAERGSRLDQQIEHERDMRMGQDRAGNMLGGGMLGGLAGSVGGLAIGSLLKNPGAGALIGGALGAVGGGMYGHSQPVTRASGLESRHVDDISELYKEPEHVTALKNNLSDVSDQLAAIRHRQRRAERRELYRDLSRDRFVPYDPYDPFDPYGRRRGYYSF
jgi:hypothetical protein